jgi:hypothetical protein
VYQEIERKYEEYWATKEYFLVKPNGEESR